jgi:replicative DNA helicase
MEPEFHRLPPQSIEAEESILSSILIDNGTLTDILDVISADDFYKNAHKTIFQSIAELYAKSEPADITTLSNALREKDKLEMIGGATYLVRLVDSVPIASNARHYAKIIKDKAILRRLIEAANNTVNQCFDNNGNVEAVINDAQKRMFGIDYKSEREAVVVGDAICSVIDKDGGVRHKRSQRE